jgi:hypothetical protein
MNKDYLAPDFVKWLCEENAKFRAIPFPLMDEALALDRNRSQSEFGKEPERLSHSSQTGRAFGSLWQIVLQNCQVRLFDRLHLRIGRWYHKTFSHPHQWMWDDDLEIDSGHLSFARLLASFSPSEEVSRFLPAGEGRAGKAVSTWYEHAPAGDHAATTVEATAATESTAAAECHGWRHKGNCRSKHGRGEAAEEFAFHDSDPP